VNRGTAPWWETAVIYQVYPRSFLDSDGDGIGDLRGVRSRLPYLRALGIDAVWISPFYPSPQADGGYDVADYCAVDPSFGTLAEFDQLVAEAHALGLRLLIDLVPNHTSSAHPWFRAALAAPPNAPERRWYHFRGANPRHPDAPPNDWPSVFGGSAWSRTPDGDWYLHLFDAEQPDLNWEHPPVRDAFDEALRFWLDRGVDGFRIDVAHGMVKAAGLPDVGLSRAALQSGSLPTHAAPYFDQEGVHDIARRWRAVLDEAPGDRMMVAEAWVQPPDRLARYLRPGEYHQAFNFTLLESRWTAPALRASIVETLRSHAAVGAVPSWVWGNHDVVRPATRLAWAHRDPSPQLATRTPEPNVELGQRRARAAMALLLSLPGAAYLYQGEELGLPEVLDLPPEARRDPTFSRTGGAELGRDGCRVPLPWRHDAPAFGFSPSGASWLPQPPEFAALAVDRQAGVAGSTLELTRELLALRRARALGVGELRWEGEDPERLAFTRHTVAGVTRVVVNLGVDDWPIPAGATILVATAPIASGRLAPESAVWLA